MFRIGRMPWATSLQAPSGLAWHRFPFDRVQRVRHRLGGTVNDIVLTVLSGALGRYLAFHGHQTDGVEVRVLVPVNVRGDDEQTSLGNRVSFMLAGLPVGLSSPLARFEAIHGEIASLKEIDQAGGLDRLASLLGRTPPPLQHQLAAGLRMPNFIYDFVCTNVPGPSQPLYCLGHRMIEHYPWVPIGWRMGLGVAVMSYDRDLCFALTADRGVLADLDRLAGFVGEAFDELEEAVGERAEPAVPAEFAATENGAQRADGQSPREGASQRPR
jgi:WS/DGAT/MGAT family acyltransferase